MHLVRFPECHCVFYNRAIQKDHDMGGYVGTKGKSLYYTAKGSIAMWKNVSTEEITDTEIDEIAHTGRIHGVTEGGMGVHMVVAYCLIWVLGQPGIEYCINATKNTVPNATL